MAKLKGHFLALVLLFMHLLLVPVQALAKPVKGLASWYGKQHAGKKMANGERFDPRKLTAAHRSLPFGTKVKVTFLKTKQSVLVTITDRGPFKHKRLIDLSEAAAKLIGLRPHGVGRVEIEEIECPTTTSTSSL